MTTNSTKSTFRDVLLKMRYFVDPLPTRLLLKTKDESDQNTFHVATSEFVTVGQITHNKIANDSNPERNLTSLKAPNI